MEDTQRIQFKEINNRLIVLKPYVVTKLLQSLPQKLILLLFEDVWHVQLLQFLVGKVYEELLERIYGEYLETKDVKQADALPVSLAGSLLKSNLL